MSSISPVMAILPVPPRVAADPLKMYHMNDGETAVHI